MVSVFTIIFVSCENRDLNRALYNEKNYLNQQNAILCFEKLKAKFEIFSTNIDDVASFVTILKVLHPDVSDSERKLWREIENETISRDTLKMYYAASNCNDDFTKQLNNYYDKFEVEREKIWKLNTKVQLEKSISELDLLKSEFTKNEVYGKCCKVD